MGPHLNVELAVLKWVFTEFSATFLDNPLLPPPFQSCLTTYTRSKGPLSTPIPVQPTETRQQCKEDYSAFGGADPRPVQPSIAGIATCLCGAAKRDDVRLT